MISGACILHQAGIIFDRIPLKIVTAFSRRCGSSVFGLQLWVLSVCLESPAAKTTFRLPVLAKGPAVMRPDRMEGMGQKKKTGHTIP